MLNNPSEGGFPASPLFIITYKEQGRSHCLALTCSTLACGLSPPHIHNTHTAL